jgi:hypothetical protein
MAAVLAAGAHGQTAGDDPAGAAPGAEVAPSDASAMDQAMPDAAAAESSGWELEDGWARVDLDTVPADSLIGSDIRNLDDQAVAAVDDVLLTDDGRVESVVARFGGFLGFGETRVLLAPDEVDVVEDAAGSVRMRTNLTPEALEGRPAFDG